MVVVLRAMRLLMGRIGGGLTRRVMGVLVLTGMRSIMGMLVVMHGRAWLEGVKMLKRCQTRWFIMLTM
jgi:hypothetical protein